MTVTNRSTGEKTEVRLSVDNWLRLVALLVTIGGITIGGVWKFTTDLGHEVTATRSEVSHLKGVVEMLRETVRDLSQRRQP
jgi:hypothetical protein